MLSIITTGIHNAVYPIPRMYASCHSYSAVIIPMGVEVFVRCIHKTSFFLPSPIAFSVILVLLLAHSPALYFPKSCLFER